MKNLLEFEGIEMTKGLKYEDELISLISKALILASSIKLGVGSIQSSPQTAAFRSSLLTATSLLSMASAKCTLAHPPEDIDVKVASDGNLVLRCYHSPCHEWDLFGKRRCSP